MDVREIRRIDPKRIIVIDTETTGIDVGKDEILSLTIVDLEGNILFDELVCPVRRQRWPKAEEVNGISPSMVKGKKHLTDHEDVICGIWNNAELVVGYNVSFDTKFLYESGLPLKQLPEFDVMKEFAPIHGVWNNYHQDYQWAKLSQCAEHYGIAGFDAHTSLGDTEATRRCFLALMDDPRYQKMRNADYSIATFVKSLNKVLLVVLVLSPIGLYACLTPPSKGAILYLVTTVVSVALVYLKYKSFMRRAW
jgi:DNA polymerase III epsilon subunit-like protein